MKISHLYFIAIGKAMAAESTDDGHAAHTHEPTHMEKMEHLCVGVTKRNFLTTLNRGSSLISLKALIHSREGLDLEKTRLSRETTIGTTTVGKQ